MDACTCADLGKLVESVGEVFKNNGSDYHTGEQIISALNRAAGPNTWDWYILAHEIDRDADEVWVEGQLTVRFCPLHTVVKQDFGAQSIKRSRSTGEPLSIGDDRKGAATDAFKRCARLLGVGLDVWVKETPYRRPEDQPINRASKQHSRGGQQPSRPPAADIQVNADGEPVCVIDRDGQMCGQPVSPWEARGTYPARDAFSVAEWQTKNSQFGMPLCIGHQKAVKEGRIPAVRWMPAQTPVGTAQNDEPEGWPDDLPF